MPDRKPARVGAEILFSLAFRPFFLLVGCHAVVVMAVWGLFLAGVLPWPDSISPHIRHGHEMLFGFAGGAIAGFLLTAVATWTGRPPVSGAPLMALCALWLLARMGAFVPGDFGKAIWSLSSLGFWSGLTLLMAREVGAARNVRNYKVIPLLCAFLITDGAFFLATGSDIDALERSLRAGLVLILGMISLVGGRIIPAFTQNWLRLNQPRLAVQLPAFAEVDLAANGIALVFAVGFIFWPESWLTGCAALLAALAHGVRLARWKGWLARGEPLLWILHAGYAWIPVGFFLLALAIPMYPALVDRGMHALGYGAIGTLILGVAARVALGHTGRPLRAFPAMMAAFVLITLGTLVRVFLPMNHGWLGVSVGLWLVAYGLFLIQYAPILLSPRPDS